MHAALVKLKALIPFIMWKGVNQKWHSKFIENFGARHVDMLLRDILDIKRDEIQIIVSMQRKAVKLHVAFDLQMLPRVEKRPRRRRQAHAADIEVREAGASFVEYVFHPRQAALARFGIRFVCEFINQAVRQPVNLDQYQALRARSRPGG